MTALWVAGAAQAQVQAPADPSGSANAYLGDIVVTAQRRDERAQDVPIAITAFSPERLQQQGITQPQNLQARLAARSCLFPRSRLTTLRAMFRVNSAITTTRSLKARSMFRSLTTRFCCGLRVPIKIVMATRTT